MEGKYSRCSISPKQRNHPKHSASTLASESAQPWTATRCHRLLRPLLAHIAALRKEKERRTLLQNGLASAASAQSAKPRRTVLGKRSYPDSDSDYNDKRPCRKYSSKASRRRRSTNQLCTPPRTLQKQRRQPGNKAAQDVVLPTPLLRRVRNHQPSSPAQPPDARFQEEPSPANSRCSHVGSGCKTKCAFEMELAALRRTVDPERHGLYEPLFKAFDALLRVTSVRPSRAAGPASLLAMCLRKVPAYIAALEDQERKASEDSGTKAAVQDAGLSFEVYSELESLGTVEGWRHLGLLLQAHAVQYIQEAVSEGLIEEPVTDLLIRLCLEYMTATECMGLIKTYVVRQYPKPQSAEDDLFKTPALQPLRILTSCDPSGLSLRPGIMTELLTNGLLPPDWILTKSFTDLWPSTVRRITEMKPCQDTADFVVATLELLCDRASPKRPRGVPQTRLRGKPQNTLVSAIAALGSVVILSEEGLGESTEASSTARTATIRRRIEYVVTACSAKLKHIKKGGRKLGRYLLALCSFLSLDGDAASASTVEMCWRGVRSCRGKADLMLQYDATMALISAVSHCCGRGTGFAPRVYLSRFCDKLKTLALPAAALSNMRVDCAFRLAEHTGDLRDLDFAENLQAKAATACTTPEQTSRGGKKKDSNRVKKAPSFSGLRWDDGISEWVAATPAIDVRPPSRIRRRSRLRCPMESAQGETDMGSDTQGDIASETEPERPDPDAPTAGGGDDDDDSIDSASETDETGNEADTGTLSPNTEASPAARCESVSETSASRKRPHPDGSDKPQPASSSSPPVPAGGFLAARARRLSRPISRAGDELAFDDQHQGSVSCASSEKENWLCKKKPTRFRPAMKRVARASRVYVQPLERPCLGDEWSDDELSFI
ncbi:uncharacterized protein B0T15DRAFT_297811 [Chaetomium strumarium]|uniref:Uncharacterized protein n=1 Tax=Chaetomium strumarium TaxID=1170767 RepID=A0AAJ0LYE1_9PEZI|nr:hypothetical protein B0T15DRAFT_297811 [Chaetomium strumarium]